MKFYIKIIVLFMCAKSFAGSTFDNPIMFVTQFPIGADFTTIGATFGNHTGRISNVGRGGDLYIRYSDGTLRNLTREAGYGEVGMQGEGAIAVRDPTVHWNSTKALFSMVVGAPEQYDITQYYWQMYEISGFGVGETIVITKIPNQPIDYNNITPIYSSDGNIIFTTDMPRSKNRFNYPQKDEYESSPTNTGLWKLNTTSGDISLMQHSPSGSFSPFIGSQGRLIFTRWDHLQRDQQASPTNNIGAFNYVNEPTDSNSPKVDNVLEVFPEPRDEETDLLAGTNMVGLRFNHFFPWQLNQDGTEEETLNHVGRHELHGYFNLSLNDDPNLIDSTNVVITRPNTNPIENTFMLHEDPNEVGRFIAIEAPEFGTHSSGQIIAFKLAIGDRPDLVIVDNITHEMTRDFIADGQMPPLEHIGLSRDPLTLVNGDVIASHTNQVYQAGNDGTTENPIPRYDYRLKKYTDSSGLYVPSSNLTTLGDVSVSFYSPDVLVTYNGPLWELQATEVVVSVKPSMTTGNIKLPEQEIFNEEAVNITEFQNYLKSKNLAVVVMRDVTTRDSTDQQQPFNLKVPSSGYQNPTSPTGKVYGISHMQFFQGDQVRGSGGFTTPEAGQRVIAQYLHDDNAMVSNIAFAGAPIASTEIYGDGSVAFFVPARRATTWQSLDPTGIPVVRERYWLNFQPGEIRACGGCHGVNNQDQEGNSESMQKADAFRALLQHWKQNLFVDLIFENGFE